METKPIKQVVKIILDGIYTPSDYFEGPVPRKTAEYTTEIADGKVEVTFTRTDSLPTTNEQAAIHQEVERIFKIRKVESGRPYEWNGLGLKRHYSDGTRDLWCVAQIGIRFGVSVDHRLKNKDGTVVRDSKAEHLAQDRAFRERCLRHSGDALLNKLITSFCQAVDDNENMFVRLYEIREALVTRFGGEKEARQELGISDQEWKKFGKIANFEPIQESRHRGQHLVQRPATELERGQAFAFARTMIQKYLDIIDSGMQP